MGYYTYYRLEIKNANKEELNEIGKEMAQVDDFNYALGVDEESSSNELCPTCKGEGKINSFVGIDSYGPYEHTKWYDHEEDMLSLSSKFPNVLFVLSGEGEEPGDIWKKYFKGGKSQKVQATISFENFDESKLK